MLHKISTKEFISALGGSTETLRSAAFGQLERLMLALLKLRGKRATTTEMLIEYCFGWDCEGGPFDADNSLSVAMCKYSKKHPAQPILCLGFKTYILYKEDENVSRSSSMAVPDIHIDLRILASISHRKNAARLARLEFALARTAENAVGA